MSSRRSLAWLTAFGVVALVMPIHCLHAQEYPSRQITLVVPFPPGGPTDLFARLLADGLSRDFKQPVIVENRSGAGGSLGTSLVAKSAPDGYTLSFGTNGTHAVNALIYPKLSYDPLQDFAPIALVSTTPNVLLVRKSLPVKSVAELLALAKSQPGKLTFGSGGSGASNHLAGELLKVLAGIDILHVPYRGNAAALVDLLGERIDMAFDSVSTAKPHIGEGTLRPLGVTSANRSSALPDVPTLAEAGVAGYDAKLWWGVWAPAKTPAAVIDKLNASVRKVLDSSEVKLRFGELGAVPGGGTPDQLGTLTREELSKWTRIARDANIKFD